MTLLKAVLIHASMVTAEDTRVKDRSPLKANWEAGPCPPLRDIAVENFSKERWVGNWYEIYRDRSTWFELGDHCVTATWTCDEDLLPGLPDTL
jgi:lipocalin